MSGVHLRRRTADRESVEFRGAVTRAAHRRSVVSVFQRQHATNDCTASVLYGITGTGPTRLDLNQLEKEPKDTTIWQKTPFLYRSRPGTLRRLRMEWNCTLFYSKTPTHYAYALRLTLRCLEPYTVCILLACCRYAGGSL